MDRWKAGVILPAANSLSQLNSVVSSAGSRRLPKFCPTASLGHHHHHHHKQHQHTCVAKHHNHREHHSVAVDSEGVAYSWGSGGSRWDGAGALGLGDLEDKKFIVPSPTEVTALSDVGAKVCETRLVGVVAGERYCGSIFRRKLAKNLELLGFRGYFSVDAKNDRSRLAKGKAGRGLRPSWLVSLFSPS